MVDIFPTVDAATRDIIVLADFPAQHRNAVQLQGALIRSAPGANHARRLAHPSGRDPGRPAQIGRGDLRRLSDQPANTASS
jgi:hypothetical protein